jgi:hypothetical protein
MNNILENKLSMYQKVQGYMVLHTVETAAIPAVATLKNQFDTKISAILALASSASADITGFTVDKQVKRTDLKAKVIKLSTAIVAQAAMTDNFKLIEKCDETPSALDGMRDNDFYTYAKLVISEATPLMALLTPFGVVAADLTNANASATTYLSNIQGPRVQINERSRSLSDIEDMFSDVDDFLKSKLDKIMKVFMASNISLYRGYEGSRGIDQTRGAIAPDYTGTAAANGLSLVVTLPYLAGRTFEIQNTGSVPLTISLSATLNTMEGTVLSVDSDQYAVRNTVNLNTNPAADKFYIQNTDASVIGSYEVWIVE